MKAEKAAENSKAQEKRSNIVKKLTLLEEEKKSSSKNHYKQRVKQRDDHIQKNYKKLKALEKKEQEIFERLKNTYNKQDEEIKRMEEVMNASKQGFYQPEPASPQSKRRTLTTNDESQAEAAKINIESNHKDQPDEPPKQESDLNDVIEEHDDQIQDAPQSEEKPDGSEKAEGE